MKGLSLIQPWAWLVTEPGANGRPHKPIENRRWHLPNSMRGVEFAICASKGMTRADYAFACHFAFEVDPTIAIPNERDLARGCVLGVGRAVACLCPGCSPSLVVGAAALDLRWWMRDQHGFVLADVRKLVEPVPVKGALGFFELPPDVEAAVRAQVVVRP